ncbi:MAG: restriction endonuclease subunit S [Candidatus Thiothrix moscowensis]|nr:restriction endonuclease subunit S [Candidatus Thiothrix moscowensis]
MLQHLDVWTSAVETRSTAGRGSSNKLNLYGIKKLRELILELAVRGQLVPQNPDDEPASVLLEKIAAEKARLIKDGKLKKQEPLPPITDDEKPFELPKGWEWSTLSQVIASDKYAIKRGPFGSALKKAYFVSSGYKIYEQKHAIGDDFSLGEYYIDEQKFKELQAFEVKPNDLIISCSGTVGRVAIAPSWMDVGIINQALLKITLNEQALINNYFKILFPAFYMKTEILTELQGTAQKNMVSVDTLKTEAFPLPPLTEQHRIVAKVNELMSLCDTLEQEQVANIAAHQTLVEELLAALTSSTPNSPPSLTLPPQGVEGTREKNRDALLLPSPLAGEGLGMGGMPAWARIATHFDTLFTTEHSIDQLKQTILQLAVMGKLVPQDPNDEPASVLLQKIAAEKTRLIKEGKIKKEKPLPAITDDEKPFELPDGWEWCRLQEVVDVRDGTHDSPKDAIGENTFPLVTSKDFKDGEIDFSNARRISAKDHYEIVKRSLVETDDILFSMIGGNIGNQVMVQCSTEFSIKNVALFKYFDKSIVFPHFLKIYTENLAEQLQEQASGGAQPFISLGNLRKLVFILPPLAEQHRIVAKVDELMALCDAMKEQISAAQATQLQLADVLAGQII